MGRMVNVKRRVALVGLVLVAWALLWGVGGAARAQVFRPSQSDLKMVSFLNYLQRYYVDTINRDQLVEKAIVAVLDQLDPHSAYISASDSEAVTGEIEGKFSGIGIEFSIQQDTLRVMAAVPNGPAERNGMRAGDRILRVDTTRVTGIGLTNQRVFKFLRGPKGTKVSITALRQRDTLEFVLVRDEIPLHSVDAYYMVAPTVGYVRINRFALNTEEEFARAMETLSRQGMQRVVIDLRGNGGGVMQAAIGIANMFLPKGALVVYSKGRAIPEQRFSATAEGKYVSLPLAVLVDEYSASASEILSGALQDHDRGVLLGRRTFGKGLVQNQIPLPDGSLIRITMARYYTPSGRMIQTPYRLGKHEEYAREFLKRFEHGEFFSRDSIHVADSLIKYTLKAHRPVYGGGGILPDVFVPLDTTDNSRYANQLERRGIVDQCVAQYVDSHRDELNKRYTSFEQYNRDFTLAKELLDSIVTSGRRSQVPLPGDTLTSKDVNAITWRVKMSVARMRFGFTELIRVLNQKSPALDRAVTILENWEKRGKPILEGRKPVEESK